MTCLGKLSYVPSLIFTVEENVECRYAAQTRKHSPHRNVKYIYIYIYIIHCPTENYNFLFN